MKDDAIDESEKGPAEAAAVNWEDLRAQAAKLGITLSQLQQQQREKQIRLARKMQVRVPKEQAPG